MKWHPYAAGDLTLNGIEFLVKRGWAISKSFDICIIIIVNLKMINRGTVILSRWRLYPPFCKELLCPLSVT